VHGADNPLKPLIYIQLWVSVSALCLKDLKNNRVTGCLHILLNGTFRPSVFQTLNEVLNHENKQVYAKANQ